MYYLILLIFYLSFVAFIYFLFLVHFCFIFLQLFTFLPLFISFLLQMSPSCASFVCYYIQFRPYWPLVNPPRGTPRPSVLLGKLQSLLPLLLCYYSSWTISTHPPIPVILRVIHSRSHPRTQGHLFLLISQENPGNEVASSSAIHVFLVFQCTCHLLK